MVGPPDPVGERTIRRHVEDVNRRAREEAFGRLFPFGTTRKDQANVPCDADVSGLCDRLEVQFKALHDDRNQHRAHRYERKQPKTAKMLELSDVTKRLQECQVLLADLRFLSSNSTFASYGYDPKAHVDDEYAQDIVDLVLLGDLRTIIDAEYGPSKTPSAEPGFYHQRRIAHYERLHALHDAAGKPEEPFNNRALLPMPTPGA